MSEELLGRWRSIAGASFDPLGERLIAAWGEPHRHYHGVGHLLWLLDEAERVASLITNRKFVAYAAWFHDAIYVPGEPDNEERSAAWARDEIPDRALADGVAHVIKMTKKHNEGDADGDAALFLDMDIAILGASWEHYCAYAAGVRREYAQYSDAAFASGRWRFLEKQLEYPRVFRTDHYERTLAATARANMSWELEEMRRGRMVKG